TSTKPIALMAGGRGYASDGVGGVIDGNDAGDIALSTELWGNQFVVGTYPTTQDEDVRIVADSDATSVVVNGGAPQLLDTGEVLTLVGPSAVTYIEADKPVAVFQNAGFSNCEVDLAFVPPLVFADLPSTTVVFRVLGQGVASIVGPADARASL